MLKLIKTVFLTFIFVFFSAEYLKSQNLDSLNHAFLLAVYNNEIETADNCIKNGAQINHLSQDKASALHFAVVNKNDTMLYFLLNQGAETDLKDNEGNTPLMLASSFGYDSLMFLLIMADGDMSIRNFRKEYPLHAAVLSGNPVAVDMLLFYNAEPDVFDRDSLTPLHYAAYNALPHMTEILLYYGANPLLKDIDGNTSLYYAVSASSLSCVELLADSSENVLVKNKMEISILEHSIILSDKEIVDYLLKIAFQDDRQTQQVFMKKTINHRLIWKYALVDSDKEKKKLLKEYKVRKPLGPVFESIYIPLRMTGFDDFFVGTGVQFREINYKIKLEAGIAGRLWRNRIISEVSQDTLFQLREYRAFLWAGVSKYFTVYRSAENFRKLDIAFGLQTPFTWANYSSMKMKDRMRITYAPFISAEYYFRGVKWSLAYQYWNYDEVNYSPHKVTMGFAFRIKRFIK